MNNSRNQFPRGLATALFCIPLLAITGDEAYAHGTLDQSFETLRQETGLPDWGGMSDAQLGNLIQEWTERSLTTPAGLTLTTIDFSTRQDGIREALLLFDYEGEQPPETLTWEQMELLSTAIAPALLREDIPSFDLQLRTPGSEDFQTFGAILPLDPVPSAAPVIDEASIAMSKRLGKEPQRKYFPSFPADRTEGALAGKTVVLNQAHGWFDDVDFGRWRVQRGNCFGITEDYSSAEFLNHYVLPMLRNAGAKVQTVRESDAQTNMVIVDNRDAGYTETGQWADSSIDGFVNKTGPAWVGVSVNPFDQGPGENRLSGGLTTGDPTATATWTADIPEDGYYNVYASWTAFSARASDAQYLVHHSGGVTEVRVDQRLDGYQWNLLGNFYFEADAPEDERKVVLTNQSNDTGATNVSADAVRWGGGMGDVARHVHGVSNQPRWTEDAVIHLQWNGFGYSPYNYTGQDDEAGGWGDRPQYARWQYDVDGGVEDLIYIGWHTNAVGNSCGGGARGFVEVRHSSATAETILLGDNIFDNIRAQVTGNWVPNWTFRNPLVLNIGENSPNNLSTAVPGVLLEGLFHDNEPDATMYGEPRFRYDMARGLVHGVIDFFEQRDGVALTFPPEPPIDFRAVNLGDGRVQLDWEASPSSQQDNLLGDPATGYKVYTSPNGFGFDNGTAVTGTSYTYESLPEDSPVYFRITATNAGGESFPTEVLAASDGEGNVLVVNAFDRNDRALVPGPAIANAGSSVLNVDPRKFQSFDYIVEHTEALAPLGLAVSSASNEAIAQGLVSLNNFSVIIWIAGEESTIEETFNSQEQAAITGWLANQQLDRNLFVSGAEVAWDLGNRGNTADQEFLSSALRATYSGDDAGVYTVEPASGGIFDGLNSFNFDPANGARYDADFPDVLSPVSGSSPVLLYGNGQTAAVAGSEPPRSIFLGFPFETITDEFTRIALMARAMEFFEIDTAPTPTPTPAPTPTPDYGLIEDFETGIVDTERMFRRPTFSGTTQGLNDGTALVTNTDANNLLPGFIAQLGFQSMEFDLDWTVPGQGEMRATTLNGAGRPNPRIDFNRGLSFYVKLVSGSEANVHVWVRETGSAGPIGGDGGTSGSIEQSQPTLLTDSGEWAYVYIDLQNENWSPITGDGVLDGGFGTLEALYITPTTESSGAMILRVDDFYNGDRHFIPDAESTVWIIR